LPRQPRRAGGGYWGGPAGGAFCLAPPQPHRRTVIVGRVGGTTKRCARRFRANRRARAHIGQANLRGKEAAKESDQAKPSIQDKRSSQPHQGGGRTGRWGGGQRRRYKAKRRRRTEPQPRLPYEQAKEHTPCHPTALTRAARNAAGQNRQLLGRMPPKRGISRVRQEPPLASSSLRTLAWLSWCSRFEAKIALPGALTRHRVP